MSTGSLLPTSVPHGAAGTLAPRMHASDRIASNTPVSKLLFRVEGHLDSSTMGRPDDRPDQSVVADTEAAPQTNELTMWVNAAEQVESQKSA